MNAEIVNVLKRALEHYENFKDRDIVKGSFPILYFGDYKEYCKSERKIVTVGLNPSYQEFFNKECSKRNKKRFPDISSEDFGDYFDAYNNYFKKDEERDPYNQWFQWYEKKVLNKIRCSYYPEEKYPYRALHTDICSPLATKPTWKSLSKDIKNKLMDGDIQNELKGGVDIWHQLIRVLEPQIIICSFSEETRVRISVEDNKWEVCHTVVEKKNGEKRQSPYEVKKAKIKGGSSIIFWGNQTNIPFGSISDPEKEKIGRLILKAYN